MHTRAFVHIFLDISSDLPGPGSVDAVEYGIQTLSPKFFGAKPDFVISGPNIGSARLFLSPTSQYLITVAVLI